jgi:hypothetical protein
MIFKARLQEMAESEIAAMVEPSRLAEIKVADPHPLIKAFVVGYEGESKGNVVGMGNVIKRWAKTIVRKLHEKISAGIQLFSGHAVGTNAPEGRMPIGEVVGKSLKDIEGRESIVVACHIYRDFKHLPLDVASVETNVELGPSTDGRALDVLDVDNVTGIALGNSTVDKPGFPGATLIGALQAFEQEYIAKYGYKTGYQLGYGVNKTIRLARSEEETH